MNFHFSSGLGRRGKATKMMNMSQRNVKWMRSVNLLYEFFLVFFTLKCQDKSDTVTEMNLCICNTILIVAQTEPFSTFFFILNEPDFILTCT